MPGGMVFGAPVTVAYCSMGLLPGPVSLLHSLVSGSDALLGKFQTLAERPDGDGSIVVWCRPAEEGITWLREHIDKNTPAARALLTAAALCEGLL